MILVQIAAIIVAIGFIVSIIGVMVDNGEMVYIGTQMALCNILLGMVVLILLAVFNVKV